MQYPCSDQLRNGPWPTQHAEPRRHCLASAGPPYASAPAVPSASRRALACTAALVLALLAIPIPLTAQALGRIVGVSYPETADRFAHASTYLATARRAGFELVAFVPSYAYVDLDRIDLESGASPVELGRAVSEALAHGMDVVIKPHLDPVMYKGGGDPRTSEDHSWRARCAWRGFFDVNPMCPDYRNGIVMADLRMLANVLGRFPVAGMHPVRLDLGSELMNSIVEKPFRWLELLANAREEIRRLGLTGRVILGHNFCHHFEIPGDVVLRLTAAGRRALAHYIRGLDVLAISQYMDLTAAMPAADRGRLSPTPAQVADALAMHERNFRERILVEGLGLAQSEIPPLAIDEFGVGSGGLRHPNLWDGTLSPDEERALDHQIALGHRGLIEYMRHDAGRTVRTAILWVSGAHFDIFGWGDPALAIPEAAGAIKAGLAGR